MEKDRIPPVRMSERAPLDDRGTNARQKATGGSGGKPSREHGGQMKNTTVWPPGVDISRDLMCVPDSQGREVKYTVVVEK